MSDRSTDQRAVDEMGYQQLGSRCRMRIPPENRIRILQLAARWLLWSGSALRREALLPSRVGQVPWRQFACFSQAHVRVSNPGHKGRPKSPEISSINISF